MSRVWQSGAELQHTLEINSPTNVSISTAQSIGAGAASYLVSNSFANNTGGTITIPKITSSSTEKTYYFKEDIYIHSLADASSAGHKVRAVMFQGLTGGNIYNQDISIYNSGGTLKLNAEYNVLSGTAESSDLVNLGVGFDTWFRFEAMFDGSGADGSHKIEVRINGVTVINRTNLTFQDTSPVGIYTGVLNATGTGPYEATVYFDNIALNSSSTTNSSPNTSWVGEEYIVRAMPNAAGDSNASAGTYASINEIPATTTVTSSANRIELNTSNIIGWYKVAVPSLNNVQHAINAISVPVFIRESAAGVTAYNVGIKSASGGRQYWANGLYYPDLAYSSIGGYDAGDGVSVRISPNGTASPGAALMISDTDPTTGAKWKVTGTNSLTNAQIGARCNDNGGVNIWVASMGAMVAYSPKATTNHGMMIMFW